MKGMLVGLTILVFLAVMCQCAKKPTPPVPPTDPGAYFPINQDYAWTYVQLGTDCHPGAISYVITAVSRSPRPEGSGWNFVSSASGDTSFVYRLGDTIFYQPSVESPLPAYKVLVGPIKGGTSWKDSYPYDYEYTVMGLEDLPSAVAGQTYRNCAKIRRTASGLPTWNYFWWAPQYGKVKEAVFDQSGNCSEGAELQNLTKNPDFP
ncbi:MAG: hypothetical protein WCE90_08685 [Candidatus Zixiibacteriota bacterium]